MEFPACLAVRKLVRAAQLKLEGKKAGLLGKLVSSVSSAPFMLSGNSQLKDNPLSSVASADKLLFKNPNNVSALALLGKAAAELGWNETAVFAFECAREEEPDRPDLLLGLGAALLAVGRAEEAVKVSRDLVQLQPNNADAQALFRNASIAVTVAKGKWEASGDYRGKLLDEKRAAELEAVAKTFPKPGKPKTP